MNDRSVLGALAVNTGGLTIDHGWLRCSAGPACWNGATSWTTGSSSATTSSPASTPSTRTRARCATSRPDTLEWIGTEMGHSEWVHWTLAGDLAAFYEHLRWPGWEEESATLSPTRASRSIRRRSRARAARSPTPSRKPAPMTELWDRQQAFIKEFGA